MNSGTTPKPCAIPAQPAASGRRDSKRALPAADRSGLRKWMPILDVMADPPRSTADPSDASWSQLEEMVERLHEAARADLTPRRVLPTCC